MAAWQVVVWKWSQFFTGRWLAGRLMWRHEVDFGLVCGWKQDLQWVRVVLTIMQTLLRFYPCVVA